MNMTASPAKTLSYELRSKKTTYSQGLSGKPVNTVATIFKADLALKDATISISAGVCTAR